MNDRITFGALLAAGLIVAASAHGAELRQTLDGGRLEIRSPCARQVTVQVDPSLSGKVTFVATADHPQELARLAGDGGPVAVIRHTGRCWRPALAFGFKPTLAITVQAPPAFGVAIEESGVGDVLLPAIGPLKVDASGAISVRADAVTALDVDISGSGSVAVKQAEGDGKVAISGSGMVAIETAALTALSLDVSGNGSFKLGAGTIGELDLDSSGVGHVSIGGSVTDARVKVSGVGAVALASVTGKLDKDVSGVGAVTVGGR